MSAPRPPKRTVGPASPIGLLAALALLCACAAPQQAPAPRPRPVQQVEAAPKPRKPRMPLPAVLEAPAARSGKPAADGLDGAWARVFVRANPGPFQYVAYEITARGGAGVMSHLRGMMGRRDALIRTELVSRERVRKVFAALAAIDAGKLLPTERIVVVGDPDRKWPKRSSRPIYELSYRRGSVERTVVVADPYRQDDPRYARFINLVRAAVIARVGDIGYHDPTGSETGYLHVDSVPSATVRVDGALLPDRTPVLAYPTKAGTHTVVLENKALGLKRTFTVRVPRGRSASLEVDLR